MPNQVDCLVVPKIFVMIKTELLENGEVALELQLPSTPVIRNGIAETKVVLTKQAVDWIYTTFSKYLGVNNPPVDLSKKLSFDTFAKELDESADKLPAAAFAVNPKGEK